MIFVVLIAFISLIGLITLHEVGHFIIAKFLGVRVDEFGFGFPPRILGKKFGETFYSLNLLPFGAFVRLYGEEKGEDSARSFSTRPVWQRSAIALGGVVSFWIIAVVLFSMVMILGLPVEITDESEYDLSNAAVQIVYVDAKSPAEMAGLQVGDAILRLKNGQQVLKTSRVKEVQGFVDSNRGNEIIITFRRGKDISNVKLTPRAVTPEGEGPMGVALARTTIQKYPWYEAPLKGINVTFSFAASIIQGWMQILSEAIRGVPTRAQFMGPVGILGLFTQVAQLGANYFVQFVAIIAAYLAMFNLLPIPSLDGGKLLFLSIEAARRKAVSQETEQRITSFFLTFFIIVMVWITVKDIIRIFAT